MATTFRCPDCCTEHEQPLSAAYVLSVRCAQCEFEVELALRRLARERPLPKAA